MTFLYAIVGGLGLYFGVLWIAERFSPLHAFGAVFLSCMGLWLLS